MKNVKWKKDYGDGLLTDDYVLWVDGKPTDTYICALSPCCWDVRIDGVNFELTNTLKEAKKIVEKELAI